MPASTSAGTVRFVPPSIDYAKRAARHLQRLLQDHTGTSVQLHGAQALVAQAYQFKDWFELSQWLKREGAMPSLLDAECPESEVSLRRHRVVAVLSRLGIDPESASALADKAVLTGAPQARRPYVDIPGPEAAYVPPSDDGFLAWYRPFRPRLVEALVRSTVSTDGSDGDVNLFLSELEKSRGARWLSEHLAAHQREVGRWYTDTCISDYCHEISLGGASEDPKFFPLADRARLTKLILRDLLKPARQAAHEQLLRLNIYRGIHHWRHFKESATNSVDRSIFAEFERILSEVLAGTEQHARLLIERASTRVLPDSHNRLVGHDEPHSETTTFYARLMSKLSIDMVAILMEFPFHLAMSAPEGRFEWIERVQQSRLSKAASADRIYSTPIEQPSIKQQIDDLHRKHDWWTTIEAFTRREYGDRGIQEAWSQFATARPNAPATFDPKHASFFIPWMSFCWKPSSGPHAGMEPARAWLASEGRSCEPLWKDFCEAALEAPYSIFQVVSAKPGISTHVRDLFLATDCEVFDSYASIYLEPGIVLFAQIVTVSGVALLVGVDAQPLPSQSFGRVIAIRDHFGVAGKTAARLRKMDTQVRSWWWKVQYDALQFKLPQMQNSEGQALKLIDLTFAVKDAESALVALRDLDDRPSVTRDAAGILTEAEIAWCASTPRSDAMGPTLIATFTITSNRLVASVNSEERAAKVQQMIKDRFGNKARLIDTKVTTAENLEAEVLKDGPEMQAAREQQEKILAIPGMQEAVQANFADYYRKWLDSPIPYLKGQTPRAASRSREGRHLLESLLSSMTNAPGMKEGVSSMLRRELKLTPDEAQPATQPTTAKHGSPHLRVFHQGIIEGSPIHRAVIRFSHPFPPDAAMTLWMDEMSTAILGQMLVVADPSRSDVDPGMLRPYVSNDLASRDAIEAWLTQNLIDAPVTFDDARHIDRFPTSSIFHDAFSLLGRQFGAS